MKRKERKALELNLLIAINDVLENNKSIPSKKSRKNIKNSIKKIANNTFKKSKNISMQKIENEILAKNNS